MNKYQEYLEKAKKRYNYISIDKIGRKIKWQMICLVKIAKKDI